jgi:hypothetical protein
MLWYPDVGSYICMTYRLDADVFSRNATRVIYIVINCSQYVLSFGYNVIVCFYILVYKYMDFKRQ